MDSTIIGQLCLQVGLCALSALFAGAEVSVLSVGDARLQQLAETDRRAERLQRLTAHEPRLLATMQAVCLFLGFLISAIGAHTFAPRLAAALLRTGTSMPAAAAEWLCLVLVTLALSWGMLVFGALVPRRIALRHAERAALRLSGFVSCVDTLLFPIVWLLTAISGGILRIFGVDPNVEEGPVSEDEIRLMVDVGSEKGVIDESEKEMIQNVFEFDDLTVGEFSTHRTEVSLLWMDESDAEWEKTIHDSRHSRYPICDKSVDDVIGILNAKDYFRLKDRTRRSVLAHAVKQPYFVPESLSASVLFRQMQASRNHFAVVLDEYGGMEGIVTMSDLLEQLVGDLEDEASAPHEEQEIERIDSQTWKILGSAPLEDVAEALELRLEDEDCDTFGGYVFSSYGSVPDDGAQFELDAGGMHIRVLAVKNHKLVKAVVTRLAPKKEERQEENA